MIRRYLAWRFAGWLLPAAWRLTKALVLAAAAVAAAPATLVAAAAVTLAWRRGWPPSRLARAAAACAPMLAAWLAATAVAATTAAAGTLAALPAAPYRAWLGMWHDAAAGRPLLAAAVIAPLAIPAGLAAGALAWSRRIRAMESGSSGLSPASAVAFDRRQWRHQVATARARIAAPGSVPLIKGYGSVVAGAVIRTVNHRAGPVASLPYQRMRSHQVVIGATGTGKTTLLLRLWAGFMAAAQQRYAAGQGPRPLLVVLDCKGGADARRIADRARRVLREAGARSTAVWPDEARLSLWDLPPGPLTTTLLDLIEHGTGAAAYYTDVMEALVALAVEAPPGPPRSAQEFRDRLDAGWLSLAYAATGQPADLALIRSSARLLPDIALRYRALFRRLGAGLDGPGGFGDADAWYCILEGTAEPAVAEGQARTLTDLLAQFATGGSHREILLAVDEFSAVARRLPIWGLYERARSLGLAVQVSAQSWPGLAATEDERNRIAAAADGGLWLLRTPYPEPVTALAGQRKLTDTSRKLRRSHEWAQEGQSRTALAPVADPALIRALGTGQVAYIYRGGVTYIQVKRLIGSPPALPRVTAPEPQPAELHPAAASTPDLAAPHAASPDGAARPSIAPPAWATRALGPVWPLPPERRPAASSPATRQPLSAQEGSRERPENSAARPPAPEPPPAPADCRPPGLTAFLDAAFGPEPAARPASYAARSTRQQTSSRATAGASQLTMTDDPIEPDEASVHRRADDDEGAAGADLASGAIRSRGSGSAGDAIGSADGR
ncbi:MAG TPA: hypothetical protein VF204_10030 [Streptosporangiaceae bacterium]